VYLLALAVVLALLTLGARVLLGCAAVAPIVSAIAGVPAGDPAYVAALAGARAIQLELADAGASQQAKLDAILAEVRALRRKPAPAAPRPDVVAGPWDASADGAR
jgi:hypothetical protein